jgi:hypothetical protein
MTETLAKILEKSGFVTSTDKVNCYQKTGSSYLLEIIHDHQRGIWVTFTSDLTNGTSLTSSPNSRMTVNYADVIAEEITNRDQFDKYMEKFFEQMVCGSQYMSGLWRWQR